MNQHAHHSLIEEVLAAERAWAEAHRDLDLDQLANWMADDYTHILSDGSVVGKEADLASYRSGQRRWDFAESDQYHVRIYGETAVLIGRWRARGTNAGQPFDYAARFTSVYVRRDGRWQMVAAQSTPIAQTQPGDTGT